MNPMPPLLVRPMNLPPRRPRPTPPSGRCRPLAMPLASHSTPGQVIRRHARVWLSAAVSGRQQWRCAGGSPIRGNGSGEQSEEVPPPPQVRNVSPNTDGPASPGARLASIDKSLLAIPEPKRLRDKDHLRYVATHPCFVCGRQPAEAHHLKFSQPSALGRKVSDAFTVPLCPASPRSSHHRQ